ERHIKWTELICIEQDASLVIVYAVIPQPIPVELRKETAEWLMGINYELMNGAFEMDSSDGELRFRSTILCPDGLLQESVLSQIFADHEEIMNHYIPAISEML